MQSIVHRKCGFTNSPDWYNKISNLDNQHQNFTTALQDGHVKEIYTVVVVNLDPLSKLTRTKMRSK